MPGCAVSSCSAYSRKTRGTEITFHSFPRDLTLQNLWLKLCKRKDTLNMKYATICSQHFTESDYIRDLQAELLGLPPKRRLKDDAVPSLNLPQTTNDATHSLSLNALKDDEELRRLLDSSEAKWRAQAGLLCRLCAKSDFKCIPIFQGKGLEQKLLTKIQNYLPLNIHKDDKLPDQVCPKCLSSLNTWHKFTEDCVTADQRLRKLLCEDIQVLNLPISKTRRKIAQDDTADKSQETNRQVHEVSNKDDLQLMSSKVCVKDEKASESTVVGNVINRRDSDNTNSSTEFIDSGYMSVETVEANSDTPLCTETSASNNNLKIAINNSKAADDIPFSKNYVFTESVSPQEKFSKNEMHVYTLGQIIIQNGDQIKKYIKIKTFTCDVCSISFSNQSDLEKHKNAVHMHMSCIFCSSEFGNTEALMKHESEVHGTQLQSCLLKPQLSKSCPICSQEFTSDNLRKHLHCHVELCATCLKIFTNRKEYEEHRKCHYVDFLCEACGKKFETKSNLYAHKQTHIKPNIVLDNNDNMKLAIKLQCDICGSLFKNKIMIQRHMVLHGADNRKCFACQTCGKEFHRAQNLSMHVKAHSEHRPHKCHICHKSFKWKKNLKEHQLVHTGRKDVKKYTPTRVQCDVCGKFLASKQYLTFHMNLHNNIHDNNTVKSSFMCHICGKILFDSTGMNRHIRTHGGIKLFPCSICNRSFSTKMSKEDHERGHTGEKPFRCGFCGKCFSSRPHLNVHQKIHSSVRPHKCTFCDKSFRRRSHLVFHIRTHTGDKRFVCDICSKAFIQKNDRNKHMLIHTRTKTFSCKCGLRFYRKEDLLNHQSAYAYDESHLHSLTSP